MPWRARSARRARRAARSRRLRSRSPAVARAGAHRRGQRQRRARPDPGRLVLPDDGRRGAAARHAHAALGRHRSRRSIPEPGAGDRGDRRRGGERRHGRARPLPAALEVFTGGAALRPLDRPAGLRQHAPRSRPSPPGRRQVAQRLPDRARVRRHERVQPAALRQPAVEQRRPEPVGRDLRARARRRLRRAQGASSAQNFVWGVGLSPRGNDNPNAGERLLDLAGRLPRRTSAPGSRPSPPRPAARRR